MHKEEHKSEVLGTPVPSVTEAFRAGEWIIDPELNSLRKGNDERRIEPKVMKVLLVLAARPNHVVSKEELMGAVWPETFVGDDVLTRCISLLRRATQDDAHAPRFIQTIPKGGYRLVADIGPIDPPDSEAAGEPPAEPQPATQRALIQHSLTEPAAAPPVETPRWSAIQPAGEDTSERPLSRPQLPLPAAPAVAPSRAIMPSRLAIYVFSGITVLLLLLLATAVVRIRRTSTDRDQSFRTLPFTFIAGEQWQPAFSPDGKSVAFAAVSDDGVSRHLYVKQIGSDNTTQITFGDGEDFSPAWSPDGKQVAFLSRTGDQLGLYIATLGSREARKIFIPQQMSQWEQGALSWSPDGKTLVFPDHIGSSPNSSLFELDLHTLQTRVITTPPVGWEGDLTPAYSPDGQTIAFTRASETAVRDIYCLSRKDGVVRAVTHDHSNIDSLAWADGKNILFSSNRGGKFALWKTDLSGKQIDRLPVGTEDAVQPAVGAGGSLLAYAQGSSVWSILRITPNSSAAVVSSTQHDSAPSLSPDGTRFAFQSQRSGFQEIWTGKLDGSALRQLTHENGSLTGSPSWSHRGDRILFDSRVDGHSHIFAIPAGGGPVRQLTSGGANDIVPRWSNDDSTIYFRSNRGGRWQLWRMKLGSGESQPVTTGDGIAPQESPDGKLLFYTRGGEDGIWSIPLAGGEEQRVMEKPLASYWGYWQGTTQGIYYLDRTQDAEAIRVFHPDTGRSSLFAKAPPTAPAFAGLAVSADGKEVLLTEEAHAGRHITLVQKGG